MIELEPIMTSPRLENVIEHFESVIFANLPRMNRSLQESSVQSNTFARLNKSLSELKKNGSEEEKKELFRYLVRFYLNGDLSPIVDRIQQRDNEMIQKITADPQKQRTLFDEPMGSHLLEHSPGTNRHSEIPFTDEWLLNRIFMKMNFYSAKYVADFLIGAQQCFLESDSSQTTLYKFIEDPANKMLLRPESGRVMNYILRTGESFLEGMTKIQNDEITIPFDSEAIHIDNSLIVQLKDFFLSETGNKIFPKWYCGLNRETKEKIIEDLLQKIPF